MFLIRCRTCREHTPVTDDTAGRLRCQACGRPLDRERWDVVDDPVLLRRRVLRTLVPLADGLLAYGIFQCMAGAVAVLYTFNLAPTAEVIVQGVGAMGVSVLGALIAMSCGLIRRGRWWQLGLVACGMTALSPFVVGLPLGVWGLWKLTRPEVKAAFEVGRK